MGLYWEEIPIGEEYAEISEGRTVTEADIVNFACLTGDFNSIHVNKHYCETSNFGERIAHGLLGLSYVNGLGTRMPKLSTAGTVIAFMSILNWKFKAPIRIGDTIYNKCFFTEKKEHKKPDRGTAIRHVQCVNQKGEVVQEGDFMVLVKRLPKE